MLRRVHARSAGEGKKLALVARLQACGQLVIPRPGEDTDDRSPPQLDDALAAFGLAQESEGSGGEQPDLCWLWPCNAPTFRAWQQLQTQWRHGATGVPTGLDYSGVVVYLRQVLRLKADEFSAMFSGLQAMEFAALEAWAEKASNSK